MTLQKIEFMYDIPEGYRFVRFGVPQKNEHYLVNGQLRKNNNGYNTCDYPIVEKIPEQERPTPQPELKLQYKTQQGDWCDVDDGHEYRIKPKARIIRFRNWLSTDGYVYASQQKDIYKEKYFKEWLGDWQEVEIEEND